MAQLSERWVHADHPDDERFDNITVEIVPRWKESELSGDEYRFSYVIKAWRKGEVIVSRSFSRLDWALKALNYVVFISDDDNHFDREAWDRTKKLCAQPGCAELPTIFYKRLKPYTKSGEELVEHEFRKEYRQFCDKHKVRGDCALDDADHNYEVIGNPYV